MAFSYEQILHAQYEGLNEEEAQAIYDLEAGRHAEDAHRTTKAAHRILEIDKAREALERRASGYAASQQQAQSNRFGLSRDELDVAKASGISDEQYAVNKNRMQQMKAAGYWDQGRVFK